VPTLSFDTGFGITTGETFVHVAREPVSGVARVIGIWRR
jgi:hypothetical protein